jgi:hypothetical protein
MYPDLFMYRVGSWLYYPTYRSTCQSNGYTRRRFPIKPMRPGSLTLIQRRGTVAICIDGLTINVAISWLIMQQSKFITFVVQQWLMTVNTNIA